MKDRIFNLEFYYASCYNEISFILKIIYPTSLAISGSTKIHTCFQKAFLHKGSYSNSHSGSFTPISDRPNITGFFPTYDRWWRNELGKLRVALLQTRKLTVPSRNSFWCNAGSGRRKSNLKADRILRVVLESLSLVYSRSTQDHQLV